ncbi:C-type lectin domain-containing protein [Microseira sp. BLCC-F43]|uniref:C-type lectin domain-containing protein n=1 Tax=Microseira sp. BLCC-F43 TaxID=3153602 RepID=UPI0035B8A55D
MSGLRKSTKLKQRFLSMLNRGLVLAALPLMLVSLIPKRVQATVLFNSATGHYYEFVPGRFTWNEAKSAAETRIFNNLQGYLTTITSQVEMDFIVSNLILPDFPNPPVPPGAWTNFDAWGWIGASDAEQEGIWKWVTGPEAGTIFWSGGAAVNSAYSNWSLGEPNNLGNEDYAHLDYRPIPGTWNDWTGFARQGYYVEYGTSNPDESVSVPESNSALGLFAFGALGVASLLKRKQQQQVNGSGFR